MMIPSDEGLLKGEDWEGINKKCGFDVMDIIINLDNRYTKSEQMVMVVKRCNKTAKAQRDLTLRQVRELLDGIKNPYLEVVYIEPSQSKTVLHSKRVAFDEAIQTIKALLEE